MEALGQLTGGIAHDFNNLLTVVVGGLDIIAKRAEEPKLKRYAENALAAAERGARLTAQLLAFSRVQRLEVRPTYVAPLIENMRPLLRNVLGPGITKEFDLDEALMPVMADPTQLEVAILNLAINARDAMPGRRGPDVHDEEDRGRRGPRARGRRLYRAHHQRHRRRACRPKSSSAHSSHSSRPRKSARAPGLGLSMVYGMARQSGGAARIESRLGEGTAVRMYFRKADANVLRDAPAATDEIAHAGTGAQTASMLVIDDDPDVRGFIAAALEDQGYLVRQASDGREGLAEVQREKPDLVIVDFVMPGDVRSARSLGRSARKSRSSRSCSCPATAKPKRSSEPRPTRRCSPSRSAPTRCTERSGRHCPRRHDRRKRP